MPYAKDITENPPSWFCPIFSLRPGQAISSFPGRRQLDVEGLWPAAGKDPPEMWLFQSCSTHAERVSLTRKGRRDHPVQLAIAVKACVLLLTFPSHPSS